MWHMAGGNNTTSGCVTTTTLTRMVSSPCIVAATLVIAIATLLLVVLVSLNHERRRLPPGPATLPVIGNLHQVIWHKPAVYRWIHGLLEEMSTDILCLRLGATHVIAVTSPEIAREVLCKNDAAFASRPTTFASSSFSFGYKGSVLTPHGEQWRKMRRVLGAELLAPSMERRLRHLRGEESDHLVRRVHDACSTGSFVVVDVRHVAQHFCGNMIRRLAFGKRHFGEPPPPAVSPAPASGPGRDEVAHVGALFTLLDSVYSFSVSDYFPALVGLDLDGHEKVVKDVMRTLNRLHDPIIEERIRERSALRQGGEKREARDFLDVLVCLEDAQGHPFLSIDEIRAQILEIMFAIVDNPSNAVEWALAEMMNKPEVMRRAIDELHAVVGKDRLVQEPDVPRLNYLKSCIREALRIHPYHALHPPRVAAADATVAGYTIPEGSHVVLSRVGLGRNPEVWTEPLEFRPERHLDDADDDDDGVVVVLGEPALRFVSFSTGRRGCPGASLGTSVTMMLFARMLQGFTWTAPAPPGKISLRESSAGLAMAEPLVLRANPRLAAHLYAAN